MQNKIELKEGEILVLRNCHADGSTYNGFVYPKSGIVKCPDWRDTDKCGNGLHGLPWGVGSTGYFYNDADAVWLVIRVSAIGGNYRHGSGDLTGKCKFNTGFVEYYGNREGAISLIAEHLPHGLALNYATQTAGYDSTQTAGDRSTQTAGYDSTQTAGDRSTQTAGYNSTQKAGDNSTQKAGDNSTQTAGYDSTQTAGYRSTQTAGDRSTQTAGDRSTQTAGENSVQVSTWWDNGRWFTACRLVTPELADKWYFVSKGVWRECTEEEIESAEARRLIA